jgi:predicted GNAT family acetyltransferase
MGYGDPRVIESLINSLPTGEYQYALLPIHLSILKDRLQISTQHPMWRMHLVDPTLLISEEMDVEQLGIQTLDEIKTLFGKNIDRPDSFTESQVEDGHFFGIKNDGVTVAVAGTHVVSEVHGVAALGNVFTHPEYRNQGYAKKSSSAVCKSLLEQGIEIIVLNVGMENLHAISVYKSIGFMPYCGYYEGIARLNGP